MLVKPLGAAVGRLDLDDQNRSDISAARDGCNDPVEPGRSQMMPSALGKTRFEAAGMNAVMPHEVQKHMGRNCQRSSRHSSDQTARSDAEPAESVAPRRECEDVESERVQLHLASV